MRRAWEWESEDEEGSDWRVAKVLKIERLVSGQNAHLK